MKDKTWLHHYEKIMATLEYCGSYIKNQKNQTYIAIVTIHIIGFILMIELLEIN